MKKSKIIGILVVVVFWGMFLMKGIVLADDELESGLPIGSSCSQDTGCGSGVYCNEENWCVSKSSNCYSTIIGKEVPTTNYVCDGDLTKYSCSNGEFKASVANGCTEEDSTTEPNSPSGASTSASTGYDVGAGGGSRTTSGNSGSSSGGNEIIPNYPSELFTGESVINLSSDSLTVGGIFSKILPYIYTVAGLILLFMLIMGGLGLMTAAGDPKKMEASQGRITAALIGFLIVFISYFVVQLVEIMLNVQIL